MAGLEGNVGRCRVSPTSHSSPIEALDIGCGTGEVMRLMKDRGWHVVMGVDQDDAMLKAAADAQISASGTRTTRLVKHNVCTLTPEIVKQQVHLIWTSFTAQYFMASLQETLKKKWETLLLPGGLVVIVENDGLFSVHEPCVSHEAWRRMEEELLQEYGYDCFAGSKVAQFLKDSSSFDVVMDSEWNDPEFAFDGPPSPEILQAWQGRLDRMRFPLKYFGNDYAQRSQDFLDCLQAPDHRTTTKLRLIVGRKRQ